MPKVGASIYSIRISGRVQYELGEVHGKSDFGKVFYDHYKCDVAKYQKNEEQEKIFTMISMELGAVQIEDHEVFRYLYGVTKSGSYGLVSEIVDTNDGTVAFEKEKQHAEVMPFKFLICIVPGKESGMLILQDISSYGITTIMKSELNKLVKSDINVNSNISISSVVPHEYLAKLFNESYIKHIRLFEYELKPDKADRMGKVPFGSKYVEHVFHSPEYFSPERKRNFIECFKKRLDFNPLLGIEGAEYDNIKLDFQRGKSSKTVSFKNFENMSISEDITEEVELTDGHPDYLSTREALTKLALEYLQATGLIAKVTDDAEYKHIIIEKIEKPDERREKIGREVLV